MGFVVTLDIIDPSFYILHDSCINALRCDDLYPFVSVCVCVCVCVVIVWYVTLDVIVPSFYILHDSCINALRCDDLYPFVRDVCVVM